LVTAAPLSANAIPTFNAGAPVAAPILPADFFRGAAAVAAPQATATPTDPGPLPPAVLVTERQARVDTPAPVSERASAAPVAERVSAAPVVDHPSPAPVPVERAPEASLSLVSRVDAPPPRPAIVGDDPALIRDALQRYRRAYNALDARLAHAVYPGVDETALTHAFDGLRSQSLEFEACSVDAIGASARAICRGQARYVTKIGSREPRAEPRVWTFRLRKDDGDWTIESAWTNR
jgi:hypothetical protein